MKRLASVLPRLRPEQVFVLVIYSYWLRLTSLLDAQGKTGACTAPPIVQ